VEQGDKKKRQAADNNSPDLQIGPDVDEGNTNDTKGLPRIEVGPAALRVFARVFHSDNEATAGIQWQKLVAALADAGCFVIISRSGSSAVTFRHSQAGSIDLHRPYPEPEVDPDRLLAIRTRLTQRFGWCSETFVERQKVAS
jgi:hypothetical protein